MTLVQLSRDTPIFHPRFGPSVFGKTNWGQVSEVDAVVDLPAVPYGEKFEDTEPYTSFHMVFVEGKPWDATQFFKVAAKKIQAGEVRWNCRTVDELRARLERDIRGLYESMKQFGYMSQRKILTLEKKRRKQNAAADRAQKAGLLARFTRQDYHTRVSQGHEIKIGIGADGTILFLDGRHRLSIARLLDLEPISARVVFRHADWDRVVRLFAAHAAPDDTASPVALADHPDLERFPVPVGSRDLLITALQEAGLPVPAFRAPSPENAADSGKATPRSAGKYDHSASNAAPFVAKRQEQP